MKVNSEKPAPPYEGGILVKMLLTVRPDFAFLLPPEKRDMVALKGRLYNAVSNKHGALSVKFDDGETLGIKPGEFEIIFAPDRIMDIWKKYDYGRACTAY